MSLPVSRLLRSLPLALAVGLTVFSACDEEEPRFVRPNTNPLDIWIDRDEINFIDATNVPQVQIDRFVAANDIDTTVTASGLVYEMLEEGSGRGPSVTDTAIINYRGYRVNGQIFDQTTVEPGASRLAVNRFIPGWVEGLQLMRPGGRMWMLVRPSLGYGTRGIPDRGVGPTEVLVFEIELVSVVPE